MGVGFDITKPSLIGLILLLAWLPFNNMARAQSQNQNTCSVSNEAVLSTTANVQHITGVVSANQPHRRLANVTIELLGTPYCTVSNEKGEFVLNVEANAYPSEAILLLTRQNYASQSFPIYANQPMVLSLTRLQQYSNEEILDFYFMGRVKPDLNTNKRI